VCKDRRHSKYFDKWNRKSVQSTFVMVLNACASLVALEDGRCAHEQIIQSGWDLDVFVGTSLVDIT